MAVMQWAAWAKYIKPQMDKYIKIYKLASILGFVLCACGFVGFALTGFLVVGRLGLEYFPFILIPFFCFPLGMFLGMYFLTKKSQMVAILSVADAVRMNDSILIVKLLPLGSRSTENEYKAIIQRLIETGNLQGYEIVADVMVAKTSLGMKEYEAKAAYDEYIKQQQGIVDDAPTVTECPHCGAPVENPDAKFCQYCGKIIK